MSTTASLNHETGSLRKNSVGVLGVVFLVIATNGPLTALIGGVPAAITLGNGIGIPGVFLAMGLMYLIFSIGFSAMSTRISNAGAFYAYIAAGLGRPMGIGAAFGAMVSYSALQLALYALFGFFSADLLLQQTGIAVPWWVMCGLFVVLVHFFAGRNIQFNGKFLTLLMLAEVGIIVAFDIGAAVSGNPSVSSVAASFSPSSVFTSGFGAAVVFVASSYMGFETAAIYSEEARTPHKTIPRATFLAVLLIMTFYSVSTWLLIEAYGPQQALAQAANEPGALWFKMCEQLLGHSASTIMQVLMITSLFAAILSFHNTITRYMYALGREHVIWNGFARLHCTQQTPIASSTFMSALMLLVILACAFANLDPLATVMPLAAAPASIGIVAVQALTAIAVIGFFRKHKSDVSGWATLVAPLVSGIALTACLLAMVMNISLLTGVESSLNDLLPIAVFAVMIAGWGYAHWLKRAKPSRYQAMGALLSAPN